MWIYFYHTLYIRTQVAVNKFLNLLLLFLSLKHDSVSCSQANNSLAHYQVPHVSKQYTNWVNGIMLSLIPPQTKALIYGNSLCFLYFFAYFVSRPVNNASGKISTSISN